MNEIKIGSGNLLIKNGSSSSGNTYFGLVNSAFTINNTTFANDSIPSLYSKIVKF